MHNPSNFALNLKKLQGGLSLAEFSRELSIPKSTLQSILKGGNTTLDTALRISNSIETPLDILTGTTFTPQQFELMNCFLVLLNWYHDLSAEKRQQVQTHLAAILCIIDESCDE